MSLIWRQQEILGFPFLHALVIGATITGFKVPHFYLLRASARADVTVCDSRVGGHCLCAQDPFDQRPLEWSPLAEWQAEAKNSTIG